MTDQFTWIPIYQELATELSKWQSRQAELIAFLEKLRSQDLRITSLMDSDENGATFLLKEIDPFSFFGVFNRQLTFDNRIAILRQIKVNFNLQSPIPEDFNGIPILNNLSSRFFANLHKRKAGDVEKLWKIFNLALEETALKNNDFSQSFDEALTVRKTNINLTMGLFWIRPNTYLSLDQTNLSYLDIKLPKSGLNFKFYLETIESIKGRGKTIPEISMEAWLNGKEKPKNSPVQGLFDKDSKNGVNYWLVGAYWSDRDPSDQTQRFIEEGIWENGYDAKFFEDVKSMQVGDRIGIKASATKKKGLPFDGRNNTISVNIIKAIGTIVENRKDGKIVEVDWDPDFTEKNWYFYTNRGTVWHVSPPGANVWKEAADQLIKFVWYGQDQDYDWFTQKWWETNMPVTINDDVELANNTKTPYSPDDIVDSGVFLERTEINQILTRLSEKKAMIIQGSPGVGKTFIARKLAYALMKEVDNSRLEMVQFHQSYSYDDFVRGYRPLAGKAGSFGLQNGVFFDFCQKASDDPDREYVFIIDEINRGNLSQIFGELLMLIESDKRSPEFALPLVYRYEDEERFYVPPNLYLIGLMNVADRSLAMVDYALRRRFVFTTLKPQFESDQYRQWLIDRQMDINLIDRIIERMTNLNMEIREDPLLGENYQVGHSFFCPKGDNFAGLDRSWYDGVVRTEIAPLLKEYWFDNQTRAEEIARRLLA